ncbi:MAG: hypothetical protein ACI9J5_003555, partial [Paraglaciecola sp.]
AAFSPTAGKVPMVLKELPCKVTVLICSPDNVNDDKYCLRLTMFPLKYSNE